MKSCHMIRSIRIRYRVEYGLAARPTGRFYCTEAMHGSRNFLSEGFSRTIDPYCVLTIAYGA